MMGRGATETLVVHDAEVARYDFVLQHGAGWYINPITVVGDDDDGALSGGRATALVHISKVIYLFKSVINTRQ